MMGMGLYMAPVQRQVQTPHMRQELRQLMLLLQLQKDRDLLDAVKGLEGIQAAHEILQTRHAVGVLIGGLSHDVWNRKRTPEELAVHKDTDVLVTSDHFTLEEQFEGGIDWWLPHRDKFSVHNRTGGVDENIAVDWWENGNGIVLSYSVQQREELAAGLYIADPDWVAQMRVVEAEGGTNPDQDISDDVFAAYFRKIKRQLRETLMPALRQSHDGFVLSPRYGKRDPASEYFSVAPQDWSHLMAVRGTQNISS